MDLTSDSSTRSNQQKPSRKQKSATHRWWIVLPIVIVSMTVATTDPILLNDLMIQRYRMEYGLTNLSSPSMETACSTEHIHNDSNAISLAMQVQKSVSQLNIIMAGVGVVPATLAYIILGANCDRIGRRPLLILPCVGRIIRFVIILLLVKLSLSDPWLVVANAIDGLFGSNSVLILGAIAYISDCTTNEQRSKAMILEEVSAALTRIFPLLGIGFWLQHYDYTLPVSISLGINVAALIYIIIFQPESCGENNRSISYFFHRMKQIRLAPVRDAYRVFLVKRSGNNQRTIILLTLTQILLFIVLFGFATIHPLYLYGKPLCFDVLDLAILTSAQFSLMIFISLILSFLRNKITNSLILPVIGILLYCFHLVLFGTASTIWLLYIAVFVGCLFFVVMAVLRSRLTKLVNETEYALVFIAIGIVETAGSYIIGITTNAIYFRTVETYPGIIFFIVAGIALIPLGITGYLFFWLKCTRKAMAAEVQEENLRRTIYQNEPKRDSSIITTRL